MCEELVCQFCGKECKNKNSLVQHEIRCKDNPSRIKLPNRKGHGSNQYIKAKELGLCKPEMSEEARKRLSERMSGDKNPIKRFSGDKNPAKREDVRKKISEKQKENYRGKSRFILDRSQEPYSEKYFREWLEKEHIDYKKNYHVDRFFLDFAFPDKKIYFEVNGEQHYGKMPNGRDYQERDKERIDILSSVGWRCIATVRWSIFMSLAIDERSKFLSSLKQAIYDASIVNLEYSYLLSPKYEQLLKRDIAIKSGKVNSLGRKCPFKITNEEMNFRKEAILNSGIDLSKFGWVEKVSKATGLTRRQIYKVVNSTDLINYVYRR